LNRDENVNPDETTLTLSEEELHIVRLALTNWDGWVDTLKMTIPDHLERVLLALTERVKVLDELNAPF
jgi:hypothetical protein